MDKLKKLLTKPILIVEQAKQGLLDDSLHAYSVAHLLGTNGVYTECQWSDAICAAIDSKSLKISPNEYECVTGENPLGIIFVRLLDGSVKSARIHKDDFALWLNENELILNADNLLLDWVGQKVDVPLLTDLIENNKNKDLTWRDLFIREFNSLDFRYYCDAITAFIESKNELPKSHNELFSWLKMFYQVQDGKPKLPNGKVVTRNNLRVIWNRYTDKYNKNTDQ